MTVKTVVLSSKENFVWHSMQEIIPAIERTWMNSARQASPSLPGHQVIFYNIDDTPMSAYVPEALQADNIVLTCFNHKIAKVGKTLRQSLGLEARYFIYLHNQATIACWPFHSWELAGQLREDDVFLSSCALDQQAFSLCFENSRAHLIPFTKPFYFSSKEKAPITTTDPNEVPFIYVGRLSEQKNLHTLIYSFSLFLKNHPAYRGSLQLYGGEDHLGSPNMGMKSGPYEKRLEQLCETLQLKDRVRFLGFHPREEIQERLKRTDHIFVSPSLHSDENFGMAAFFSLMLGQQVVLSRWGGHGDYPDQFPGQVNLIPVYGEHFGPWICPFEFAEAMSKTFLVLPFQKTTPPPERYEESQVGESLYHLALNIGSKKSPLRPTEITQNVLKNRQAFASRHPSQIFSSYEDPLAQNFFRAYGMRPYAKKLSPEDVLSLVPWVFIEDEKLIINDPHRGRRTANLTPEGAFQIQDFTGRKIHVSEFTAHFLLKNGWASSSRQESQKIEPSL